MLSQVEWIQQARSVRTVRLALLDEQLLEPETPGLPKRWAGGITTSPKIRKFNSVINRMAFRGRENVCSVAVSINFTAIRVAGHRAQSEFPPLQKTQEWASHH